MKLQKKKYIYEQYRFLLHEFMCFYYIFLFFYAYFRSNTAKKKEECEKKKKKKNEGECDAVVFF